MMNIIMKNRLDYDYPLTFKELETLGRNVAIKFVDEELEKFEIGDITKGNLYITYLEKGYVVSLFISIGDDELTILFDNFDETSVEMAETLAFEDVGGLYN